MASFEDRSLVDAIRVYRPTRANDAKGWWRYAILAVRYQVRCSHREELWRQAGIENMNILTHIRSLIESCVEADVDEDYDGQTTTNLHNLEMVVDDLHRENMALRKMIKSLLTPLAREGFQGEGISVEDIEKEVSVYEEYATKGKSTKMKSPQSTRSHHASPLKFGGDMEDEADDQIIEDLANSIGSAQLNIHSPYESFLPSISPNSKTKRAHTFHGKSSPHKQAFETSPSYVEREALRRETLAKKKEQDTVRKADQLLRTSMLDNPHSPTSYLPVLKNRHSPTIHIPSPRTSPHRENGPSPVFAHQESESSAVVYNPEQGSQVSVVTNNNNKKHHVNISPPKNRQPEWCDNVNIVDKEFIKGRGKGRPREPEPIVVHNNNKPSRQAPSKATKSTHPTKQKKTDTHHHQPTSNVDNNLDNSDAESQISHVKSPRENSQSPLFLLGPKHGSEMSDAEKLGANAIAKARGKHRSKENAKKPLTNLEKHLIKSPLALPVVKAPVNPAPGMPTMSPRERALRSNASPRVQSFIYQQKVTHKPVIVLVGGANGSKEDKRSEMSVVDKVNEMMQAEQRAETLQSIENRIDEGPGGGHLSAENSVHEAYLNDTDDRSYFEAPPDSPGLNLNSADISASPSPARAVNTTHNPDTTNATEYMPSLTSSADGTSTSGVTTASNNTNTHTNVTNNSASTSTPTVPHRSVHSKPSPRVAPRNTAHNSINKANNNTTHRTTTTKSTDNTKDSQAAVELSPRSRKEQISAAARLSLSPQRSPRHTTTSDNDTKDSKSNLNKAVKRTTATTSVSLVSKSAPNSSVVSKAANGNSVAVGKLNLNNHISNTMLGSESPGMLPSSPARQTKKSE